MNYEFLFSDNMQVMLCILIFSMIITIIGFILDKDTPASIVILIGIVLIIISGIALWYTDWMKEMIDRLFKENKISLDLFNKFNKRSNIFMYMFPFVSAAIGTNLISDVLTKKLHYNKKITQGGIFLFIFESVKIIIGFILLVFITPLLPFILASQLFNNNKEKLSFYFNQFKRRIFLNLLKVKIILRNLKI